MRVKIKQSLASVGRFAYHQPHIKQFHVHKLEDQQTFTIASVYLNLVILIKSKLMARRYLSDLVEIRINPYNKP